MQAKTEQVEDFGHHSGTDSQEASNSATNGLSDSLRSCDTPDTEPGTARQCAAMNAAGEQCRQFTTTNETGLCLFHDPARAEQAREARSRGGQGRTKRVGVNTPRPLLEMVPDLEVNLDGISAYAAWIVVQTATGTLDARAAQAMTNALSLLRIVATASEMAGRLKAQEAELKKLRRALAKKAPASGGDWK